MTPEELRSLADEATPGPWEYSQRAEDGPWGAAGNIVVGPANSHPTLPGLAKPWVASTGMVATERTEADARLIALAPDLARLCAEYAGAFEQIEKLHPKDRAESAHIARRALAKLSELQP